MWLVTLKHYQHYRFEEPDTVGIFAFTNRKEAEWARLTLLKEMAHRRGVSQDQMDEKYLADVHDMHAIVHEAGWTDGDLDDDSITDDSGYTSVDGIGWVYDPVNAEIGNRIAEALRAEGVEVD